MAFPDDSLGNQWTNNETLNADTMHQRIDVPLNALRSLGYGRIDAAQAQGLVAPTFGDTANHTGPSPVTFTLNESRFIRIDVQVTFQMNAGTSGFYLVQCAFVAGGTASVTAGTLIGIPMIAMTTVTGGNGRVSMPAAASQSMAAGTWTAFPAVRRVFGGDPTDYVYAARTEVTDVGSG